MPKPFTFPTLINECKTLSIKKLNEWNYLNLNSRSSGTISWSRHGEVHSRIDILVDTTDEENMFVRPFYTCNEKEIDYKIQLVRVPSNLKKGKIWMFVCPHTNERCRILHMVDTYFWHRSAFTGWAYVTQTYSKKFRKAVPHLKAIYSEDHPLKKHFKKFYKGKPTKRYLKCLEIERLASVHSEEFLLLV